MLCKDLSFPIGHFPRIKGHHRIVSEYLRSITNIVPELNLHKASFTWDYHDPFEWTMLHFFTGACLVEIFFLKDY